MHAPVLCCACASACVYRAIGDCRVVGYSVPTYLHMYVLQKDLPACPACVLSSRKYGLASSRCPARMQGLLRDRSRGRPLPRRHLQMLLLFADATLAQADSSNQQKSQFEGFHVDG